MSDPVSDDDLRQLPGRISQHFDRVRELIAEETHTADT